MALHFHCRFAYPNGFQLDLAFRADGGVTALWGPSGVGKTTVLNLIAGVLRPKGGTIRLGNRILFDSEKQIDVPLYRRRVGYVFQDYQLFPHLTVAQNLVYGARRAKHPTLRQDRMIDILGIGPLLKKYPRTLSGGEQQRVALGRAMASGPELLLLDEPVSALDLGRKSTVLDYLETILREFQLPALVVSHDAATLEKLKAHRIELGTMESSAQQSTDP